MHQSVVGRVLSDIVLLYIVIFVARGIIETVLSFSRDIRPSGTAAMILEVIFTVTDPPLKALRRLLPPLRAGNLDLSFTLAFFIILVVLQVIRNVLLSQI